MEPCSSRLYSNLLKQFELFNYLLSGNIFRNYALLIQYVFKISVISRKTVIKSPKNSDSNSKGYDLCHLLLLDQAKFLGINNCINGTAKFFVHAGFFSSL